MKLTPEYHYDSKRRDPRTGPGFDARMEHIIHGLKVRSPATISNVG